MPAVHPHYPCPVCARHHVLYLPFGATPNLERQLFLVCMGTAARITERNGWMEVDSQPPGSITVMDGGGWGGRADQ
jgi:hypothetical protein